VAASHNAQVSPGAAGVAHRSGEKRRQRRFERAEMVGKGNEEQGLAGSGSTMARRGATRGGGGGGRVPGW